LATSLIVPCPCRNPREKLEEFTRIQWAYSGIPCSKVRGVTPLTDLQSYAKFSTAGVWLHLQYPNNTETDT